MASAVPGLEIHYTCYPGPGVVHPDAGRDTVDFSEITNVNIANLLGITLQVERRPRGTWSAEIDSGRGGGKSANGAFYVNRLKVSLDLTTLNKHEPEPSAPDHRETIARYDAVVAATVDCILDNASRSDPPIRRIDLDVIGSARYGRYARGYTIKPAPRAKLYRY